MRCGVRWAETMVNSKGTPNSLSTSAASCMMGRSESDPMIMLIIADCLVMICCLFFVDNFALHPFH